MVLHFDTESADLKVISRQDQYNLTFSEPRKVRSYLFITFFVIRNLMGF